MTPRSLLGARLKALEGDTSEMGEGAILKLMEAVDSFVKEPEREIDKPFIMPVEDVFTISGRGTVVTGRVERGIIKVGEEIEIVGFKPTQKTVATGVEMFRKLLDEGRAGDNIGVLLAWYQARGSRARTGFSQARQHYSAHQIQRRSVRLDQGRRWASYALLQWLSSAVLFPHY